MGERFAVIGLGYVGLPVAVGFARAHGDVLGFDIDARRIAELEAGFDRTGEVEAADLRLPGLRFSTDPQALAGRSFLVVTVPTPIDGNRQPDLRPLCAACRTVGQALAPGAVVVFESTVFPGATREVCVPLLEACSGLRAGQDFGVGYSPERINPGDREHRLETIVKVIAGDSPATLARLRHAYGPVVRAGLFEASSIEVAEAAKVIENTQRDLNIALVNEIALICDRLGIRTKEVLQAAGTKWNFLRFTPGLVGGHCIGVDPYYLTSRAESLGYHPEVILAGRRINDGMGVFLAQKLVKLLIARDIPVRQARVGILGLAFKENVPDIRNSRVVDMVRELASFGIAPLVHDPLADPAEAERIAAIRLSALEAFSNLDGLVWAVAHAAYRPLLPQRLGEMLAPNGVFVDVKSMLEPEDIPAGRLYWSL
ncbi:UDP-N-acetyl-D-glucosamine 6-dehydrogenase [bacterium HR40]|nr:UDP-N-acetyl-D-glucosamine 6-dehydrogenase [bacterium HR40]